MVNVEKSVSVIIEKHENPSILNGRDYQIGKEIYELSDRGNFATYSYVKDDKSGGFVCVAKSIGYPMAASVQIANPEKYSSHISFSLGGNYSLPSSS